MDTYYPHDYDSSIRQLSAIHLRNFCTFTAKSHTSQRLKSESANKQISVLRRFGYIKKSKQSALLNLTPVSKDSLAKLRFVRQLIVALAHHEDECLTNYLGSKVTHDSHRSLAA